MKSFRKISYAITKIFQENTNFFCLIAMFIFVFAQIFYVTKFWNEHAIFPENTTRSYHWYLYWCWEFVFGNYEYGTPEYSEMYWVTIVSIIYSFFFTFLLANTLVALVQASYGEVNAKAKVWDTRLKLKNITIIVDYLFMNSNFDNRFMD